MTKYKTSFSATVTCVVAEEKDKFLSKASIDALKSIIPAEFVNKNDLLPIAFNACVVNRVNKNGDAMDTATALKVFKDFLHKPINIEHDRYNIVGHIVNASLSKFSQNYFLGEGSELLNEDSLAQSTEPFNISLAGVLYKVSPFGDGVIEAICEATDPNSPSYLSFSTSWELGFNDYYLAVGSKNLSECELITDPEKIRAMEVYCYWAGGKGKTPQGKSVYRVISGDVVPLGIGITTNPAADVKGIVVPEKYDCNKTEKEEESEPLDDDMQESEEKCKKAASENDFSVNVDNKQIMEKTMTKESITNTEEMKAVDSERPEGCVQGSADYVSADALAELAKEWKEKVDAEKNALSDAQAKIAELEKNLEASNETLQKALGDLDLIKAEQEAQKIDAIFQTRIASVSQEFKLGDGERAIVAKNIKNKSEEEFAEWLADFRVMHKAQASVETEKTEIVASAGAEETQPTIPNTIAETKSFADRMAAGFKVQVKK